MSELTQTADPSSATAIQESPATFDSPRSGTPEYAEWRKTGTLPEKKAQPQAELAPADTSKETPSEPEEAKSVPDPEAGKSTQESRRKPGAEARIGELTARLKQLEKDLEEARRLKSTQAESSTAKPAEPAQPQTYQEWRKTFKAAKWVEQYAAQNPDASYEDSYAAMSDYMADVRDQFTAAERARSEAMQRMNEAQTRAIAAYPDFEEVAAPMADKVMGLMHNPQVNDVLKRAMIDPEGYHILYALGKDPAIAGKFEKLAINDPAEAIFLWKQLKADVQRELGSTTTAAENRNEKGQFIAKPAVEETPAKRGPESAPAPPIEIGSRGSAQMDDSDKALSALERGDPQAVRRWIDAENAKELRRRKGL